MDESSERSALLAELRAEVAHAEREGRPVPRSARELEARMAAAVEAGGAGGWTERYVASVDPDAARGRYTPELPRWRAELDRVVAEMGG